MKSVFKVSTIAVLVSASLAACSGNSSPVAEDVVLGEQRQWVGVSGTLPAHDPDGDTLSVRFYENGSAVTTNAQGYYQFSHGLLQFDGDTLEYIYIPIEQGIEPFFEYVVSDGDLETSAEFSIGYVRGDALANYQWHLRNTEQTAFAMSDETIQAWRDYYLAEGVAENAVDALVGPFFQFLEAGEDLNVLGAYKYGVTGEDSIVVVVDQGLALDHEDLAANILDGRSVNLFQLSNGSDFGTGDPTDPTVQGNIPDHGTAVAGLIAAEGWNDVGGRGVAPSASLIGMNYMDDAIIDPNSGFTLPAIMWDRLAAIIHGGAGSGISSSDNVVAFNRSYGYVAPAFQLTDAIDEALYAYPTQTLRRGLGALNVKSAGNSFVQSNFNEATTLCDLQQQGVVGSFRRPISCADANWDSASASFYSIAIGALAADGYRASYSTAGANLWVSAPAGENGSLEPAMITTDQTTCSRGYASWFGQDNSALAQRAEQLGVSDFYRRAFPFNSPEGAFNDEYNSRCNYTNTFNGTSSAAPNVSGVIALIAEANPELSWREIRYILAATATQVTPEAGPIALSIGDDAFYADRGWVENAAGYSFHAQYGFGRPDAGAAVELALSGDVSLPELTVTEWSTADVTEQGVSIPDNNATGAQVVMTVIDDVTVEGVQFGFDIVNEALAQVYNGELSGTTAASDIGIEVTSPMGTTAVLASSRSGLGAFSGIAAPFIGYAYATEAPLLSNAFLGEQAAGDWTVRFVDTNGDDLGQFLNNSSDSVVLGAQMRVFGH